MPATVGDVATKGLTQRLSDYEPTWTKAAVVTATKYQNKTNVSVDVYIPVSGAGKVVTKLFNAAKVEVAALPEFEGVASTKQTIQFRLPPEYYFECVITAATVGEALTQT